MNTLWVIKLHQVICIIRYTYVVILTLKSNPFSAAKRFAKGLASIRDPIGIGTDFVGAEAFGATGAGGGGAGAEVDGLGDGDGAAGAGAPAEVLSTKSLKAATSDSFSTIIHTSWIQKKKKC